MGMAVLNAETARIVLALAAIFGLPAELVIYLIILVLVTGILAFLYKKYTELVKMFLEEKLTYLEWTIKLFESLLPLVPDEWKKHITDYLAFLKWWKAVNEALLGASPTKVYKLWLEKKERASTEIQALKTAAK
jgi:hypothetical protein